MVGYINFGNNAAQAGFQNALAMGMQMGAQAREARERKEYRNALANYDPSNPESIKAVMAVDPRTGLQLQQQAAEQQAKQREGELVQAALGGDQTAFDQLATVNFDKWKALDTRQKDAAAQESKIFGNAALDILNSPPEQRQAKVQAYAAQLGPQYPDVMQIAQLPPDQLETVLRSAVFEAQMIDKLIALEQPKYMAIPEGGTLVNTRDPQAVQQFGQRGAPVQIADEAGYNALPPGAQYYDPQGNLRTKGGAVSNDSGGF
jgi:hypothetical protein